jgi:hypothetical protein
MQLTGRASDPLCHDFRIFVDEYAHNYSSGGWGLKKSPIKKEQKREMSFLQEVAFLVFHQSRTFNPRSLFTLHRGDDLLRRVG